MKSDELKLFEQVRKEMIESGSRLGFQHPRVIELSQKLDRIHNEMLKKDKEKVEFKQTPRIFTLFEVSMQYEYYVS